MSEDGLTALQQGLPIWVRLERRSGEPMVSQRTEGNVRVTEVKAFPEAPLGAVRADLHFVVVAPTEGFPSTPDLIEAVRGALGHGVWSSLTADDLEGGPSYITLGAWLGSQDLALMLIGAVELAGIARAITPEVLGLTGETADRLAGSGAVMLGPWKGWKESVE